jgi:hypothetical protein
MSRYGVKALETVARPRPVRRAVRPPAPLFASLSGNRGRRLGRSRGRLRGGCGALARVAAPALFDARSYLQGLVGQTIPTITGKPNTIVAVRDDSVFVPDGRARFSQS